MKNLPATKQEMLNDGFTEKMADHYRSYIQEEVESDFEPGYMQWAHSRGFVANHAMALGLTESNYENYVSDYDFYRCWPHNSWLKMWINDKLSLKYILQGTRWESCMPAYFYYSMPNGDLRALVDNPCPANDIDAFKRLLKEKGCFACKPNNGTESVGFHKLSYEHADDAFRIDGERMSESQLEQFVGDSPNYIYTEYITAGKGLEKVHPSIHTIRVVVINEDGRRPEIVGGYIRFPVDRLGSTNYTRGLPDDYMYYVEINFETGEIGNPTAIYAGKKIGMPVHPDTGFDFSKGLFIPDWHGLLDMVKGISSYLFGLELLGFDIGVTDAGFKIMEINGLPGCMGNQWPGKATNRRRFAEYIRSKNLRIDSLTEAERLKRRHLC